MTQASSHQTKFRWTENLTCRFIQLRKENGKLFTGRKYSAQAGWEYILQQMREEFPATMADVHYRVLKKKWSNLLQQYKAEPTSARPTRFGPVLLLCICHSDLLKELKNPVHGDRNKADDVSWPFYGAIDEVLGHGRGTPTNNEEYIDPHEFLCVSVTPEEPASSSGDVLPAESNPEDVERRREPLPAERLRLLNEERSIRIGRPSRAQIGRQIGKNHPRGKRQWRVGLAPRLPAVPDLPIGKVTSPGDRSKDLSRVRDNDVPVDTMRDKGQAATTRNEDEERPRKSRRTTRGGLCRHGDHESRIDRRIEEIFEYTRQRDEENRSIMVRIMNTVETIAKKL